MRKNNCNNLNYYYLGIQSSIPFGQSFVSIIPGNNSNEKDITVENILKSPAQHKAHTDLHNPASLQPQLQHPLQLEDREPQQTDSDHSVLGKGTNAATLALSSYDLNNPSAERIILNNIENTGKVIQCHQTVLGDVGKVAQLQSNTAINYTEATVPGNLQSNVLTRDASSPSNLSAQTSVVVSQASSTVSDVSSFIDSHVDNGENHVQDHVFLDNSNGETLDNGLMTGSSNGQEKFNLIDFISTNCSDRTSSPILPADISARLNKRNSSSNCEVSLRVKGPEEGQAALLDNIMGLSENNVESLTLPLTPKGSCGSGYGLGLDVDDFLNSEDGQKM